MVEQLFLAVPRGCLQFVIVVFPDHTHLLFFTGMDADIDSKVHHCRRCVRQKTRPVQTAKLVNVTSSAPMELVCIDYLSLEMSKGRHEHILVITHHFTRYAMASPTRNKTAWTFARVLFDNFIAHYGFLARLHSDKAQNFEFTVSKHLCKVAGIKKTDHTISPYEKWSGPALQSDPPMNAGTLEPSRKSDLDKTLYTLLEVPIEDIPV